MPLASLATAAPPLSTPVPTSASDTDVPATGFVNASRTSTCTAGATFTPATAPAGCTANVRFAAAAAETVKALLVAVGSTPLEARSCLLPARSTRRLLKLAMPDALLTTAPPPVSVPPPRSANVTDVPATGFVNASRTCTWTAGAIATPATSSAGWTAIERRRRRGETVNALLVTAGSAPPRRWLLLPTGRRGRC